MPENNFTLLPFLKSLISTAGLSGNEAPVREIILQAWRPLADEITVSRLGSLHALRRGTGPEPRRRILVSAHMDAIGLIVTGVTDGFLSFTSIGGIDARILPGQPVIVHGREDLPALIVAPPARLLPESMGDGVVPLEYLFADTGLLPHEVTRLVRAGDLISFAQPPQEMNGEILCGHSLDNRASVAALTACLDELQYRRPAWDLWAVASVQEEITLGGAATSAFDLLPDLAVAVDVTFAKGPGSSEFNTFTMGKGVTLGWGPDVHPGLHRAIKDIADRLEIPYQLEVMPRHSGTDAYALQVAAQGIPTMVIGIPLRYMHTPVEIVSLKDIYRAGRLLADVITRLDPAFLDTLNVDKPA
ncbi:MAG TPA: M20/M25/M40 family metallo-hydrolase [Anaerolineaceae bacterium]|nr:M20/M25/M40 family metallo-hydrolase [Anaerolineaceae bacterium]